MARLPDMTADDDIAARIRARRGGELRPLDAMLLHSPPVADGWNQLMGAIRGETTVPADLRELVILRIAVLNDAPYEWDSHQEPARLAGLSDQQLEVIRAAEPGAPLSALQQLVIAGTDAMTRGVRLPEPLFERLRGHLSDRQVFELVTTVAAYNMVQRAGGDVEALLRQRQSRIPIGFMGDGRDTAYAALYLASDEARFVTGTEIVVDGGMTARCD